MLKAIFQKQEDPKELVRKWQSQLRTEQRALDRQVREIQFEEKKIHRSIKEAAKRGDMGCARSMAKEILNSRKAVTRIYTNKAHLMTLGTTLTEQMAMVRVAGAMQRSTEVMREVNAVIRAPELSRVMMEMGKEMMKAGLIDEMISDAIDDAIGAEDEEEETDAEVARVLAEIAGETAAALPNAQKARPQRGAARTQVEEDEDEELQARLAAVRL